MDLRIHFAIDFMRESLQKPLALSELASLVDLSESRFRCLFTMETGVSPKAYLRRLRLAWAKEILAENRLSIDQIAMKIGWQDRSHFERRFKQLYGVTPAQYRNAERCRLIREFVNSQSGHVIAEMAINRTKRP